MPALLNPDSRPSNPESRVPNPDSIRILIVRLGSLGDIVHALPAAAALRCAFPQGRIDWLVDWRHRELVDLMPAIDGCHAITTAKIRSLIGVIRALRRSRYDVALDLQGLLKSAVLARSSGARRVIGFARAQLREPAARAFYTETGGIASAHVIDKNLSLLRTLGVADAERRFPLELPRSAIVATVRRQLQIGERDRFAIINPGAAWPNKRWPAVRFGELAAAMRDRHGIRSVVLWGPGEEALARQVADSSHGAAAISPRTTVAELLALARSAALMVSGDTGPLHLAAAVGTPLVGIYGPTSPERNGPWAPGDLTLSRSSACRCHHRRRCHADRWCLLDVTVHEVADLVDARLAGRTAAHA